MTVSSATNTPATVGRPTDRIWPSPAGVADEFYPVAVPAEFHHADQALQAAGIGQRDGVAGALRGVDAVEAVGVRETLRYVLAEVKHHCPGVGVGRVRVRLDDHRRQLCALVVIARQRFGVPGLSA